MDTKKLNECPLVGGDIPGMSEAKNIDEKIKVLEEYYWTLELMAQDAQSAIEHRIKKLRASARNGN